MLDKDGKERFFNKSFLLANINLDIVLEMRFLIINNADIDFQAQNLQSRSYITKDVLLTTRQIELISKKEFAPAGLEPKYNPFIVYVAAFNIDLDNEVYFLRRAESQPKSR